MMVTFLRACPSSKDHLEGLSSVSPAVLKSHHNFTFLRTDGWGPSLTPCSKPKQQPKCWLPVKRAKVDFVVNAYWAIIATDRLIDRQPLLLDIKTRQKQVVRILTSSSLDVTGAKYSKISLRIQCVWIYYSPIGWSRDRSHQPMSMDDKTRIATSTFRKNKT